MAALKEFSTDQIKAQMERAKNMSLTQAERDKARRFAMEMQAYNLRTLRGDFDSY